MHAHRSPAYALTALLALACSGADAPRGEGEPPPASGPPLPAEWPDVAFPEAAAATPETVSLGRLLFYDPIVSVDRETACATCHSEIWGMTDGLARSIGEGAGLFSGPGRAGDKVTRRNAPTLWNVAFGAAFLWDGRAGTLEEQVRLPFESAEELGRPFTEVVAEVATIPEYAAAFAAAFPDASPAVNGDTFASAVAAFERTIVSKRGLYDAYVAGDEAALDEEKRRGLFLFAEAGCASCHVPPLFSSDRFEDRGVAAVPGVVDRGRAEVTGNEEDAGKFKVPTLRNLKESGPYFHTGEVDTIEAAVRHELARSEAVDGARHLEDDEVQALAAFLDKALFDRQHNPTRPGRVPSGLPIPIDGIGVRR